MTAFCPVVLQLSWVNDIKPTLLPVSYPGEALTEKPIIDVLAVGITSGALVYCILPIRAADRFLSLIQNPVNAALIREEIRSIQGKMGRHGEEPSIKFPCPHSQYLLGTAFNIDLDDKYIHSGSLRRSLLPATNGCWDVHNNDGLTLLDITDPLKPSYAFCTSGGSCSADAYFHSYYWNEGKLEPEVQLLARFRNVRLLSTNTLAEAWPDSFSSSDDSEINSESATSIGEASSNVQELVPSLANLMLKFAIARSLELDTFEDVELMLPGKVGPIKAALRAQNPFPDNALPLLLSVLQTELEKNDDVLDLAGFSLSHEHLVSIASGLEKPRIIVLSDSPLVTIDHVRALLAVKPEIDRLEICNTGVTNEALISLLEDHPRLFRRISDVVHPLLVSGKLPVTKAKSFHISASNQYGGVINDTSPPTNPALLVWTPAKVVQNLLDWLKFVGMADPMKSDSVLTSIMVPAAMNTGLKTRGEQERPWKNRTVTSFAQTASNDQIQDGGWLFLFEYAIGQPRRLRDLAIPFLGHRYAFAKISEDGSSVETYKLEQFLEQMEKEGRGPLPDAELVEKWNKQIVENLQETSWENFVKLTEGRDPNDEDLKLLALSGPIRATLFNDEPAADFISRAHWSPWAVIGS